MDISHSVAKLFYDPSPTTLLALFAAVECDTLPQAVPGEEWKAGSSKKNLKWHPGWMNRLWCNLQ
jgi:hypothetical protein